MANPSSVLLYRHHMWSRHGTGDGHTSSYHRHQHAPAELAACALSHQEPTLLASTLFHLYSAQLLLAQHSLSGALVCLLAGELPLARELLTPLKYFLMWLRQMTRLLLLLPQIRPPRHAQLLGSRLTLARFYHESRGWGPPSKRPLLA